MKCRSCYGKTEEILSLGSQKLAAFTESPTTPVESYPLDLVLCQDCKLAQLKNTVPPEKLYNNDYGYRSGINETIKADLKDIVEKAMELNPDADTAIDIGCNDGTLLGYYPSQVFTIGYEPVEKLAKEAERVADEVDNAYFTECGDPADIITAISVFYDMDDPNAFVSDLKGSLKPEGIIIIQQNYLSSMLKQNAYDNICHEHLEYYSLTSLMPLLKRHGLTVFKVEQNLINGGSFRTYVCHDDKDMWVHRSVADMLQEEQKLGLDKKETYEAFANRVNVLKNKLHQKLKDCALSGSIYAYGASTRGSVLWQASGITLDHVKAVVERNPDKIGKYYLGVPIISEEEAKKNPPDYKLILPYFHGSIIARESGKKILPLPEVKIVD